MIIKRKMTFTLLSTLLVLTASFTVVNCGGGSGGSGNPAPVLPVLKSFITSTSGSGNIATWPDVVSAGPATGLVAADVVCQARAEAAGLPGTFKAWLSDDNDDAYCRMYGLKGKKAANCGQSSLPASAGPWVRTDGAPFAEVINKLTDSLAVLTPARFDENGNESIFSYYYSGTGADGVAVPGGNNCSGWTDGTGGGRGWIGSMVGTYRAWSDDTFDLCSDSLRLLCMQTGSGKPLAYLSAGKKVFLTSEMGTGNLASWPSTTGTGLMGIAAGDAICNARAASAGLAGTYKAWLSDGTNDMVSRLTTTTGPWIRLDGVKIANDKADLIDGTLLTEIIVDENGNYGLNSGMAWTGTVSNGTAAADTCTHWTDGSAGSNGTVGYINSIDYSWSGWVQEPCNAPGNLYCFED